MSSGSAFARPEFLNRLEALPCANTWAHGIVPNCLLAGTVFQDVISMHAPFNGCLVPHGHAMLPPGRQSRRTAKDVPMSAWLRATGRPPGQSTAGLWFAISKRIVHFAYTNSQGTWADGRPHGQGLSFQNETERRGVAHKVHQDSCDLWLRSTERRNRIGYLNATDWLNATELVETPSAEKAGYERRGFTGHYAIITIIKSSRGCWLQGCQLSLHRLVELNNVHVYSGQRE